MEKKKIDYQSLRSNFRNKINTVKGANCSVTSKSHTVDYVRGISSPYIVDKNVIELDDCKVNIRVRLKKPEFILLDNLISRSEIDELKFLYRSKLTSSIIVNGATGVIETSNVRSSSGYFIPRGQNSLVSKLEQRVSSLINWPIECCELFHLIRYQEGQQFESHWDYFYPSLPNYRELISHGGQRVATLIVYLEACESGGETVFDDLGLEIPVHAGSGVYFSYPIADASSLTKHGGKVVKGGEKWIMTVWIRERSTI